MKLEDTLTLLRAGYTKEEIAAMESGNKDQHAEDLNLSASADNNSLAASHEVPGKAKEQDTGEAVKKADALPADPAPAPAGKDEPVLDAIDRLTKAIQMMNIQNSNIKGGDEEALTGEDVIANIINPPRNNRRK